MFGVLGRVVGGKSLGWTAARRGAALFSGIRAPLLARSGAAERTAAGLYDRAGALAVTTPRPLNCTVFAVAAKKANDRAAMTACHAVSLFVQL